MTTLILCFDCGAIHTLPVALSVEAHDALREAGLLRCAACGSMTDHADSIKPLQPVAVAWQDRMLEGVGMGITDNGQIVSRSC